MNLHEELKPLVVGEANPYSADPKYALYPYPEGSAGGRLCRVIMGLEIKEYLCRFDRRNLCPEKWSAAVARKSAAEIMHSNGGRTIVMLGAKVCGAFDVPFEPFKVWENLDVFQAFGVCHFVILPHPSGLCRLWNEPGAVNKARQALYRAGITFVAPAS